MTPPKGLCLNISIDRLHVVASQSEYFAIWVWNSPYPGGYGHHDCIWPENLTHTWLAWQEMFSPFTWFESARLPAAQPALAPTVVVVPSGTSGQTAPYGARLMQQLGIDLWRWLFEGSIQNSLERSQGISIGQNQPLRLRLEIRDPKLITLPWEIMQPQAGQQAISLSQQLLFSRTTKDVAALPDSRWDQGLNILLVLGQLDNRLDLEREARILAKTLENSGSINLNGTGTLVPCQVDTLVMPSPAELISKLEQGTYNILFYAGHGVAAPDGGLLFLRPGVTMNGTELAQVLTRCSVTLAVFNSCWGAQSATHNNQPIPRSSLAEVLIHHGVPAVLAMRDEIADEEAISFIEAFARALAEQKPIDEAVAVARQQLLTLYKYNHPAWTLPVLYLHPEFDGQLLQPLSEGITELPTTNYPSSGIIRPYHTAYLRQVGAVDKVWSVSNGLTRVGRRSDNDLIICEKWTSKEHAEIFCRKTKVDGKSVMSYVLRDRSRYGTLVLGPDGWQTVHHEEISLQSGMQLKFGSSKGQTWEFVIEEGLPIRSTGNWCREAKVY